AHVGMGRHGVPGAARMQMSDAHHQLATAWAADINVLIYSAVVAGFGRSQFSWIGLVLANQCDGMAGMRRVAKQIEDGGDRCVFRLEAHFRIAATNVEDIEIFERASPAAHTNDAAS